MVRLKDRERAIVLRNKGMSYSQIKEIVGVPKSVLSYWLRGYPLSKERIRELREGDGKRVERFRETIRWKREQRLDRYY